MKQIHHTKINNIPDSKWKFLFVDAVAFQRTQLFCYISEFRSENKDGKLSLKTCKDGIIACMSDYRRGLDR
jgi:hypothetical protein